MTLLTLPLHSNGHRIRRDPAVEVRFYDDMPRLEGLPESVFEPTIRHWLVERCWVCDTRITVDITREAVQVTNPPCPYPDGITTTILLGVPSGRLIVSDDLRPVYGRFDEDRFASYNSVLGQAQVVRAYASQGCAYGPVGNSCPGLYQTGDSTYAVASLRRDDQDEQVVPRGWRYLAGVITDLWAYSIADYEDWMAKGGELTSPGWVQTVVEVPPGVYEFTHHTGEAGFDRDSLDTVVFADVRRVS